MPRPAPEPPRRPGATAAAFLVSEDGTTAVEYAVMLALILSAIVGAVGAIGGSTGGLFDNAEAELEAVGFGGGDAG